MKPIFALVILFMFGTECFARDLSAHPIELVGATVGTEIAAMRLAMDRFIKQMHGNISATDNAREAKIVILGYAIKHFAERGEPIWEARIVDKDALRSIIWINPKTAKVYCVCGPWDVEGKE